MPQNKNATKFLIALFDSGGEITRAEVSCRVFRRNLSSAALDSMLAADELAGLYGKTRAPRRDRIGTKFARASTRYYLTLAGWTVLVRGLKRGIKPLRLNAEAICERLDELATQGDARALQVQVDAQDARKWRSHIAQVEADKRRATDQAHRAAHGVRGSQAAIQAEQTRPAPVAPADQEAWKTFREAVALSR